MSYVPASLKRLVIERAGEKCEYCLFPQSASLFSFEIEHVIAEKHDGATIEGNLALACPSCNRFKGSDLGSIDAETGQLTPFFNPRSQAWRDHFSLNGAEIVPQTAEGRVTVRILQFNQIDHMIERAALIADGEYPLGQSKGQEFG